MSWNHLLGVESILWNVKKKYRVRCIRWLANHNATNGQEMLNLHCRICRRIVVQKEPTPLFSKLEHQVSISAQSPFQHLYLEFTVHCFPLTQAFFVDRTTYHKNVITTVLIPDFHMQQFLGFCNDSVLKHSMTSPQPWRYKLVWPVRVKFSPAVTLGSSCPSMGLCGTMASRSCSFPHLHEYDKSPPQLLCSWASINFRATSTWDFGSHLPYASYSRCLCRALIL
jgi:hypothetical protein